MALRGWVSPAVPLSRRFRFLLLSTHTGRNVTEKDQAGHEARPLITTSMLLSCGASQMVLEANSVHRINDDLGTA